MKIIVLGATGQLGLEVVELLNQSRITVNGFSRNQIDITDEHGVSNCLLIEKPDFVINCAAYTKVDDAEDHPKDAFGVNQKGPAIIAESCRQINAPLIHISTDFVFDGKKKTPYVETDPIHPLGIYGRSKALGEQEIARRLDAHIIIRTSWLYGTHGKNFVKTMIAAAAKGKALGVVADQFGSPTSARDLAAAIVEIIKQKTSLNANTWGIYHYCGKGITSWHEFAETIFQMADATIPVPEVRPITTDQYPAKAPRPPYSALDCSKMQSVFGVETIPWEQSLSQVVKSILTQSKSHLFP